MHRLRILSRSDTHSAHFSSWSGLLSRNLETRLVRMWPGDKEQTRMPTGPSSQAIERAIWTVQERRKKVSGQIGQKKRQTGNTHQAAFEAL